MLKKDALKLKKIARKKKRKNIEFKNYVKKLEFSKKNPLYFVEKTLEANLEKQERENKLKALKK